MQTTKNSLFRSGATLAPRRLVLAGALMLSLSGAGLAFSGQKSVYVDRMGGLEPFVETALQEQELPFTFLEEERQPALKARLKKQHGSVYAEILYKNKLGRTEDHVLELLDLEKGKVVASYAFRLESSPEARKAIAVEFARRVKKEFTKSAR
jgi:hypothetical protein